MPKQGFTSRTLGTETDEIAASLAKEMTLEGRRNTGNSRYKVTVPDVIHLALVSFKQRRKWTPTPERLKDEH